MNRTLIAALSALAILPATAFAAHAGPATGLTRTIPLGCAVNASDGEALKVRIMVKNTSGFHIPEGSKVQITVRYASIRTDRTMDQTAWRDVPVNSGIGFDQPISRYKPTSCVATVTFVPNLKAKIENGSRIGKIR
jgi:hypothetical protein